MYELSPTEMSAITDLRIAGGDDVLQHARSRLRRTHLASDGKLVILAADHPGRMVTGVGGNPTLMGDRAGYLGRILRVLRSGCVDGLMGTPDIIEEALALDLLAVQHGEESFLANKLLIGCMNRGGLAGTVFEMDDTFTGFTAPQMTAMGLDGAKLMFRLDPLDWGSGRTITACAHAVDECLDQNLAVFVEPLMVRYEDGKHVVDNSVDSMVKTCGVASALGKSSWKTWLKLPHSVDYHRVASATTCPILVLGGPATGDAGGLLGQLVDAMQAGGNVRGALVGRNVLYPGEADPAAVARAVWAVVHEAADLPRAAAILAG